MLLLPTCAWAREDFSGTRSVEAYRVAPRWEKRAATRKKFRSHKVIAGPRPLAVESARALAGELERVYPIDRAPTYCAFVPRYGLRLQRPRDTVDVLVCPHCSEVEFTIGERVRRSSLTGDLLRQLKAAFPDHPLRDDEV